MPFDESAGSTIAYDYSQSRADGDVLNGATFVKGRNGNAISFPGGGTCEVQDNVLNIQGNFTIMGWVNASKATTGTPKQLIWMLAFTGTENFVEIPITITPGTWYSFAFVRTGSQYIVYLNASVVATITNGGTLQGVSLNQDYYGGGYGFGMLDDVVIFKTSLSQEQIIEQLTASKQQAYTLDGVDFKDYGVYVSGSDGILNRPARKSPYSVSFDNYHGEMVDLNHNFLSTRTISLSCFIKADSKQEFIEKVMAFEQAFDGNGTHRLVLDVHPVKPLVYEVYQKDQIEVKKEWSDDIMVGTFTLKLIEPEPVKRVLKHIRVSSATRTITINMTCKKYCNVYWGDGSVDYDVAGQDSETEITHEYKSDGEYFPVITGCIDEITSFTTNAIVVWSKL